MFFIEEGQVEGPEEGYEPEQHRSDRVTFDFAHILYIGLQVGLSKVETGRLRYGTWKKLYDEYKRAWNMRIKKVGYADNEEQSVLSL